MRRARRRRVRRHRAIRSRHRRSPHVSHARVEPRPPRCALPTISRKAAVRSPPRRFCERLGSEAGGRTEVGAQRLMRHGHRLDTSVQVDRSRDQGYLEQIRLCDDADAELAGVEATADVRAAVASLPTDQAVTLTRDVGDTHADADMRERHRAALLVLPALAVQLPAQRAADILAGRGRYLVRLLELGQVLEPVHCAAERRQSVAAVALHVAARVAATEQELDLSDLAAALCVGACGRAQAGPPRRRTAPVPRSIAPLRPRCNPAARSSAQ